MDAFNITGPDMQYLMFDLGHDTLKVGCFDKDVNTRLNYFTMPMLLYPYIDQEKNLK